MLINEDYRESIEEQVLQIARIQGMAYQDGYKKGFEEGKKQALLSVTKVYEGTPAEFDNDGNN